MLSEAKVERRIPKAFGTSGSDAPTGGLLAGNSWCGTSPSLFPKDHDVVIDGDGVHHFIAGEVLGEEAAGEGLEAQGPLVRHHDGDVVPRMNLVHHLPRVQPLYRPASDRALKTKEPLVGLN